MECYSAPYEGDQNYIFFSYCHKDAARVYPIIERLALDGYRVWYDSGIHPGENWSEVIAAHLQNAGVVVAAISGASIESHNCRNEINFAVGNSKSFFSIIIGEVKMTVGIRMQLSSSRYIRMPETGDEETFYSELLSTSELRECRTGNSSAGMPELELWRRHIEEYRLQESVTSAAPEKDPLLDWLDGAEPSVSQVTGRRKKAKSIPAQDVRAEEEERRRKWKEEEEERRRKWEEEAAERRRKWEAEEEERRKKWEAEEAAHRRQAVEAARKRQEEAERRRQEEEAERKRREEEIERKKQIEIERARRVQAEQEARERADTPRERPVFWSDEDTADTEPDGPEGGTINIYFNSGGSTENGAVDTEEDTVRGVRRDPALLVRMQTGEAFYIYEGRTVVGRKNTKKPVQIALAGNEGISRRHVQIEKRAGEYYLSDLQSKNGTEMNGRPVSADQAVPMGNIAVIVIGDEDFLFVSDSEFKPVCEDESIGLLRSVRTGEFRLLTGERFPLDRNHMWADDVLGSRHISRGSQTEIIHADGAFLAADLNSPNGTFLNGRKLSDAAEKMNDGDELSVVEERFIFYEIPLKKRNVPDV